MKLTINDILKACEGELYIGASISPEDECLEVTSVVIDSRLVTEGGVFVAKNGEKVDAHSFIGQVYGKGAKLVISELDPDQVERRYGVPSTDWGNYIQVRDSYIALKQIAKVYREKLDIPVVGITGSVGKTSTKEFIAGVLSEKYNVLKTEGNYNNEIGVPLTLLKIREEHNLAVIEMGISDFGEMTRLSEMAQPDIAVITNIGQCHLENLKTRDGILKAKTEIFKYMNPKGSVCLFGGDDKLVTVGLVNGMEPYFFGEKGSTKKLLAGVVDCEDKGLLGSSARIEINAPGKDSEVIDVDIPLPGHHMVINATAAASVATLLSLTPSQIKNGINNMKPITGRNNIIKLKDIVIIDDCYNANPVSMKSSIDLLKLAQGETIAIMGDMLELGDTERELHRTVGRYAVEKGVTDIYCVGPLSEYIHDAAREDWLDMGRSSKRLTEKISYWKNRDELLEGIRDDFASGRRELIPVGATVLIKASHGMHFEAIASLLKELNI